MAQLQSKYLVTARVGGRDIGVFQSRSGGTISGESVSDRSPGQEYPSASGGDKTLTPLTIGRRVKIERDNDELFAWLFKHASVEDAMVVNSRPLDKENNPFGKGRTWTGTITEVNEPDSDTNSENEPAEVTIVMQPSGVA